MARKFISWRRVSTQRQNASGLGLAAQKEIIRYFIERDGGEWLADYAECYTGKDLSGCVELRKAMEHAKKEDAVLIIAKSDRFRNCQEALGILDEMGEEHLMLCDLPRCDRFTLTLFWALAEREALIVSIRTKQALAAKKERGEVTGGASQKWRDAFESKSKEQVETEMKKRGTTKNRRHIESRDVQAFIKALKNVFPLATAGDDMCAWDWDSIGTKEGFKQKITALMIDYRDIDPTLFRKWDFSNTESEAFRVKLASYICNLKKSIYKYYGNE